VPHSGGIANRTTHAKGPAVRVMKDQWIDASDGTRLRVDVYLPDEGGPVPCLYAVSPYQKDLAYLPASEVFRFHETGPIEWWADECGRNS
jgi:predicted acyl esterase